MTEPIWQEVTGKFDREHGGERWIRCLDDDCWISVLHRMTGFGYMEWETAILTRKPEAERDGTWKDISCKIIIGDHRDELGTMPKDQLMPWYEQHISGNRNSMETLLEALKPA